MPAESNAQVSGRFRFGLVVHLRSVEDVVRVVAAGGSPVEKISNQLNRCFLKPSVPLAASQERLTTCGLVDLQRFNSPLNASARASCS
jgi:hypothetical protein